MKQKVKEAVIRIKAPLWRWKIEDLKNDQYGPKSSEEIKNIAFSKKDIYAYPSKKEEEKWEYQTCGIASLKMLTDHLGFTKEKGIYEMTQESLDFGAFRVPEVVKRPSDIKGVFHEGLLQYAQSFGLEGFRKNLIPLEEALWYVSEGYFFLSSVNFYKLHGVKQPKKMSGRHIVLVVGFKKRNDKIEKIFFKDISAKYSRREKKDELSFKEFKKCFNNRGVFLKIKEGEKLKD